jgi:putative drug exporter of the RND superfamily
MKLSPESLARASSRRPWRTLVIWLLVFLAAGASSSMLLSGVLTTDFDFTNNPEAKRAQAIIDDAFPGADQIRETWVLTSDSATIDDPAFASRVGEVLSQVNELGPKVVQAAPQSFPLSAEAQQDPTQAALGPIPSEDGKAVLFTVVLVGDQDEAGKHVEDFATIREDATSDGFHAFTLGQVTSAEDFKKVSDRDLRFGELIGIAVALIVLVIVFGAAVAGVTPLIMGIFAISVTVGLVALIGQIWKFSFFVPNLISMMGLAVGIDYSLFIVSRYREERAKGFDKLDAIGAAGATANRAVFFSGMVVVLAMVGMLIIPTTIFRGLAGGAIMVVLISVAASMTLLPAVIALLGDKLNAGRIIRRKLAGTLPGREGGFWDKQTRRVMGHPVWFLVGGAVFMLLLSTPYFFQGHPSDSGRGIKTGLSGVSTLPDDNQTKQAFDALVAHFPKSGGESPAKIVVQADPSSPELQTALDELAQDLAPDNAFGSPAAPQVSPDGAVVEVDIPLAGPASDPQSEAAVDAIARLRDTYVPQSFEGSGLEPLVGGDTAFVKDFFDISSQYTPIIFIFVLGLSFLLLTVVFRSIVLPVKAILMNLLSVGAAYGAIVLVFQKGGPGIGKSIADLFGFQQVDAIEAWLPLFLFSILFGLSMDYHVFLLTRIREEFDKTHDNTEAVAFGLRTTAGIITGAAAIMVAVFAGFAAGHLTALEQMGFGLAVAVFLDASIIRSIIVPASMRLLGNVNWYLPTWLQWLPQLHVEGHEPTMVTVPTLPAEELVESKE